MRLWTLHPQYLDPQGLVALWREALLARAVLRGKTRGYRHHPQLARFRAHPTPRLALNAYLVEIHAEATARGYAFDRRKVGPVVRLVAPIATTTGQLELEWRHLMEKLSRRNPAWHRRWSRLARPLPHPLIRLTPGPIEPWERPNETRRAPRASSE